LRTPALEEFNPYFVVFTRLTPWFNLKCKMCFLFAKDVFHSMPQLKKYLKQKAVKKMMLNQCFPKYAPRTTRGPRDRLKWSTNYNTNWYFVPRGAQRTFLCSALIKSLGTTVLNVYRLKNSKFWQQHAFTFMDTNSASNFMYYSSSTRDVYL
jgi:hypothetical protein